LLDVPVLAPFDLGARGSKRALGARYDEASLIRVRREIWFVARHEPILATADDSVQLIEAAPSLVIRRRKLCGGMQPRRGEGIEPSKPGVARPCPF
jgi:hypothetical protein